MRKGVFVVAALLSSSAMAQSVTLYGTMDLGIAYTNNAGGHSAWQTQSGYVYPSMWGLSGKEDLGGGNTAIFTIESGFNAFNGNSLGNGSQIFSRQSFVGLSNDRLGTFSVGRQYDPMIDMVAVLTANGSFGGTAFAHPYDFDNTNWTFRINNSVKYKSPKISGVQVEGIYGFSNQPGGFSDNRAYGAGVSYDGGSISFASAYFQSNNAGGTSTGAMPASGFPTYTNGNFVSSRQRTFGTALKYSIGSLSVGAAYTRSWIDNPVACLYAGTFSPDLKSLRFETFELNARYFFTPTWYAAAMYAYTDARYSAQSQVSKPHWNQEALMTGYYLSKRTQVYVQAAFVNLSGGVRGTPFATADLLASAGPSSGKTQFIARVGISHAF